MKYSIYIFFFLITSCHKEEKKHSVYYKVEVIGGHPNYTVKYSSTNNSTKTEGPYTSSSWTSPKIDDRKEGGSVFLTLEGGGGGSYKMYILVDGYLEQEGRMDDPYGPKTIDAKISD